MFLIFETKKAFIKLRQAFVKAPILNHFDLEYDICNEIHIFGYVISRILSQLTLDNLGQWYLVAFFSQKIISTLLRYKTYDGKLLIIIERFKTWRHNLEGCKYEVLILTDYNNLQYLINTKSLSSK